MNSFATIPQAIKEVKQGKMIIIVDDPDRENEGDFYIPTDKATPDSILTMIRFGGGLICAAITKEQTVCLKLPLMVEPLENNETTKVNFTVSVSAKKGITTGVSAFDRLRTIGILADSKSFPLIFLVQVMSGLWPKWRSFRKRWILKAVDLARLILHQLEFFAKLLGKMRNG